MRDTFYFSHDYNARTDSKIKRLIARHGMAGYGIYWAIVEDLYQNANALPTDYESIAFDVRSDAATVKSIVNDFELFAVDGKVFGSMSVQRRLDEREEKSQKARDSARKRWQTDANALRTDSDGNAIKGKKSKGKKSKGDESSEALPPPPEHSLVTWIKKHTPRVNQMKKPLTNEEAERLIADLDIGKNERGEMLRGILMSMENYAPLLSKSVSANLTIRKWWKMEEERMASSKPKQAEETFVPRTEIYYK